MGLETPRNHSGNLTEATGLLVLGMHRSGTSALTRLVNLLGADLGSDLLEPGASNELGFWEHKVAYEQNDGLLKSLGRSWDDVRSLPAGWQDSPMFASARDEITGALASDFANSRLWAVKDPRMCRLLPLWKSVVEGLGSRVAAIIALRDPEEVAGSLAARDGLSFEHGCMLWARYMLEAERDSRNLPRCVITYDEVLKDWRAVASFLESSLDLKFLDRSGEIDKAIDDFIDEGQRHHRSGKQARRSPEWVDAIYQDFLSTRTDPLAWERFRDAEEKMGTVWGSLERYTEKLIVSVGALEEVISTVKWQSSKIDWQSSALVELGDFCRNEFEARRNAESQAVVQIQSHSTVLEGIRNLMGGESRANRERQEELVAKVEWQSRALEGLGEFLRDTARSDGEARSALASKLEWQSSAIIGLGDFMREDAQAESLARDHLAAKVQWQSDALAGFGDHLRQLVESNRLAQEQLHGEIARLNALVDGNAREAESQATLLHEKARDLERQLVERSAELHDAVAQREAMARDHAGALDMLQTRTAALERLLSELRREGDLRQSELDRLRAELSQSTGARLNAERRAAGFLERIEDLKLQLEAARRPPEKMDPSPRTGLFGRWKNKSTGSDNP